MTAPHSLLAFLDGLGGPELLLVLVVVLIFFGGEKMPEFARGLGKAIREFKKAASDVEHEFKRAIDEAPEMPTLHAPKPLPAPGTLAHAEPVPPSAPGGRVPSSEEPTGDHGIEA